MFPNTHTLMHTCFRHAFMHAHLHVCAYTHDGVPCTKHCFLDRWRHGFRDSWPCLERSKLVCGYEVQADTHTFTPKYALAHNQADVVFVSRSKPKKKLTSVCICISFLIVLTMSTRLPRLRGQPFPKRVWIFALRIPTQASMSYLYGWVMMWVVPFPLKEQQRVV